MNRPRIQHVSIPRPPGSGDATRAFYAGLLGLQEKPVPETIAHLDLIWFDIGDDMELHLFTENPIDDPSGRHFCIEVDDVDAMRKQLEAAGYQPWDADPIRNRPRFFCKDPFGNTIEFTTILGDYQEGD
jgi:catechol 2,3-dioxygenase-like lactoylglutathione lyase family enzyme